MLNEYFTAMSEIAESFGGTIDKFVGDAVMIFFGAPEEMEQKEQALRAVRMALAMQQRMDHTAIGTQVNLAARLESACEPGKILISHATWGLVHDRESIIL